MKIKIKNVLIFALLIVSICFAEGASYLIITNDNFYNAIQPLAKWKHKKGIPTKVVKLSDIGASPTNIALIKNYIVNAYNNWSPRPEYVLLVGSGIYLRAENDDFDDYYANMTGDYRMELSIGRFPCATTAQCSLLVAKTLGYERTPYLTDTTWFRKATTIISEDGISHPDTVYWNDARYAHAKWIEAGYTLIDSLSRLRGNNSTSVVNSINNGRSFVFYRGSGTASWDTPFHQINPSNMTNGYKLPVVISATCATLSLFYDNYYGDRFMNAGTVASPKGSVAFAGTTLSTSGSGLARLRGTVGQKIFEAIFEHRLYRLGDALKWAKYEIDSIRPPYFITDRYREWNLFGDPELNLWTTKPRPLIVEHDTIIQTIPQNFTVTVRNSSITPVQNALVCIMMDSIIYQQGYTNASGVITFQIFPSHAGAMSVTVTARNMIPFEKNVSVTLGSLNHDVGLFSIIAPTGTVNSGTVITPRVKVKNYGISIDTCMVAMRIGSVYEATIENVILTAGETLTVTLPIWIAIPGNFPVIAYTDLAGDQYRYNDTVMNSILVNISNDIGVSTIIKPDSIHRQDSIMTPQVRVKNYGVVAQTNIPVTCSIISSSGVLQYENSHIIPNLAPNESLVVSFANWMPTTSQLCTVKFRTALPNDENIDNDNKVRLTFIFTGIEESDKKLQLINTMINSVQPNPVTSDNTTIVFSLAQPMYIRLKIYDAIGSVIRNLVNDDLRAGLHTHNWDLKDESGRTVAKGIYFCSLEVQAKCCVQKLILTR